MLGPLLSALHTLSQSFQQENGDLGSLSFSEGYDSIYYGAEVGIESLLLNLNTNLILAVDLFSQTMSQIVKFEILKIDLKTFYLGFNSF